MESKKSIRNISSSRTNTISDIISVQNNESTDNQKDNTGQEVFSDFSENTDDYISSNKKNNYISVLKRFFNFILNIKPIYKISLILIIIIISTWIIISPSPAINDPIEQAKIEAEMVKKELSKHMVLPEDEQIDIRKITSKLEDPFFQNAEIGDYLIIMYKNRIAYIYSIDKDLIINAGVVFIDPKTATTTNRTKTQ